MNSTVNGSLLIVHNCSLRDRVYTSDYLFFKRLNSTNLRLLIGPGILLNTLCLIVLSRPRLSNKSTTIFFLRFLAIFDILAITLKYIRAELNYQSVEKTKDIFIITTAFCKALYVCMNTCISIAMWTIVLMSVDKVIAVCYPLKSSIWLTQKRASHICYLTSFILLLANLSFIVLAGAYSAQNNQQYCGLDKNKDSLIVDVITASVLPIVLITAANIVIAVVLHRISRTSFNWSTSEKKTNIRNSELDILKGKRRPTTPRCHTSPNASLVNDTKRRASAQVTRMLLAVTLSLILFNIPNTAIFLFSKIIDTKTLVIGRSCTEVSADDIKLYKVGFYSSVMQDILSDLPHVVNFFLYCLAGKKFRSIILEEVNRFLVKIHLIKPQQRRLTQNTHTTNQESTNVIGTNCSQRRSSSKTGLLQSKRTINVLFNGSTNKLVLHQQDYDKSIDENAKYNKDQIIHIYSTLN